MIYNLFAVLVILVKLKGKIWRENRKKHVYDSMEPVAKKRFVEEIQKRYSTMDPTKKKELSCKHWQNYQSLDGIDKKNYSTNAK